ncbi:hypothetical protein [Vibrio ostreicida]|uniref:hypothetical protein n=1 Tax=Vibrio ostreicida TaxID=526588 RepID=UPI0009704F03|nr:hypothetical protein [Vibrio ostreicida]
MSKNSDNTVVLLFLLSIAILSQIIEKIASVNIYPMLALTALLSLFLTFQGAKYKIKINTILLFFIISCHFLLSNLIFHCGISTKQVLSLFFLLVLFFVCDNKKTYQSFMDHKLHILIIVISLFFLVLSAFGISLIDILAIETRSKIGLYSEYSHLALFVLPSVIFIFFIGYRKLAIITFILVALLSFSSTVFMFLIILISMFFYAKYGFSRFIVIFPLLLLFSFIFLFVFDMEATLSRIVGVIGVDSDIRSTSLSSIVWLNGWSLSLDYFESTYGLGVGINGMGCMKFEHLGAYTQDIVKYLGVPLNITDGSFLFSKLVSEFGFLGLIAVLYMLMRVESFLRRTKIKDFFCNPEAAFGMACCISILCLLFVRGLGYFNFPVIMVICWMLGNKKG